MATFIYEDSKKTLDKKVHLPQKLTTLMTNKSNYYGKIAPKLVGYKRAKKIASAAKKEAYNTSEDKFKDKESGVTLNYNELKRWNNALKHLPANSDAFDANGGNEGKEMVKDLVRQVQQNNHKVPMVPEVEKLVKDIKVTDKPLKATKINNTDVYVNEEKKIYINEQQLYILQEEINEDSWKQFFRCLKRIGREGTLPYDNMSNDKINTIIKDVIDTNDELKRIGCSLESANRYGFIDAINNQEGKLYIERAIGINYPEDILSYDGLGTSWSWKKGGAENYFGDGDINIVLIGYINPSSVDWEKTAFLNAYPLNEQTELRVKTDVPIELTHFKFGAKRYKLKTPLLVSSGSNDIGIM